LCSPPEVVSHVDRLTFEKSVDVNKIEEFKTPLFQQCWNGGKNLEVALVLVQKWKNLLEFLVVFETFVPTIDSIC
jgi:hypothetical protein